MNTTASDQIVQQLDEIGRLVLVLRLAHCIYAEIVEELGFQVSDRTIVKKSADQGVARLSNP